MADNDRPMNMVGRYGAGTHIRGKLAHGEPMSRHTSWRVGGPADCFYVPADVEDLAAFLRHVPPDEPLYWVGLGSNLLIRDGGIRGTVIMISGVLAELEVRPGNSMIAGAGVACARVARFAAANGLSGIEYLAGIPGTMGGALAMNAGAHGREIWGQVESVTMIDRSGKLSERAAGGFKVGYRSVVVPDGHWFVRAVLRLEPDPAGEAPGRIREFLAARTRSQPTGKSSCGSVFVNPPGDFAGRLIDACDLKGIRVGKASVSEKHANFIINDGGASAADIEGLITLVRDRVQEKYGIRLETEVRIVGEQGLGDGNEHGHAGAH